MLTQVPFIFAFQTLTSEKCWKINQSNSRELELQIKIREIRRYFSSSINFLICEEWQVDIFNKVKLFFIW